MKLITRKFGIILIIIGIAFQFLNMLTYGLWEIDIDILGALIFLVGLIVTIVGWKREFNEKKHIKRGRK